MLGIIFLSLGLTCLVSCGQKGPLYLPESASASKDKS
ncbi:LPS translocon maturation chaperone LptM [Legionella londiniensis]|nr:lipoprotein [Legionella londiniensis]